METEKLNIINSLNESFGEFSWSLSISNSSLDFVEKDTAGSFSAGAMAVVRIQLRNGVFREDMGFGLGFSNFRGEAISHARKEAVILGLKGAFISFGGKSVKSQRATTPKAQTSVVPTASSVPQVFHDKHPRASRVPSAETTSAKQTVEITGRVRSASYDKNLPASHLMQTHNSSTKQNVQIVQNVSSDKNLPSSNFPTRSSNVKQNVSDGTNLSKVNGKHKDDLPPLPPEAGPSIAAGPSHAHADVPLEEDHVKAERIRRSKLKQEEFKKKHLLQAQAQVTAVDKQLQLENGPKTDKAAKISTVRQQPYRNSKEKSLSNGTTVSLDADDDFFLSTQDIEAAVQSVATNGNTSRRVNPSPQSSSPKRPRM